MSEKSRQDKEREAIVDRAVALFAIGSRTQALALLAQHNLPDSVIGRVLCDPDRSRGATLGTK